MTKTFHPKLVKIFSAYRREAISEELMLYQHELSTLEGIKAEYEKDNLSGTQLRELLEEKINNIKEKIAEIQSLMDEYPSDG